MPTIRLLLLLLSLLLAACEAGPALFGDELASAREALAARDFSLAERLLVRYLQSDSARDPESRWQAWELLLGAVNGASQESRASVDILEAMLGEFSDNPGRQAEILARLGRLNQSLRRHAKAIESWSGWLDLPEVAPSEKVAGYRALAASLFAARRFEDGEESLSLCLALPLSDAEKIPCMLDLAHFMSARERWQETADLCQQILDAAPERHLAGQAAYLRADALEQLGQKDEALNLFAASRSDYPNPAVMDRRIALLKKAQAQKKGQAREQGKR